MEVIEESHQGPEVTRIKRYECLEFMQEILGRSGECVRGENRGIS